MEYKDNFLLRGTLAADALPVLGRGKELGCLLSVSYGGRIHDVSIFSLLSPVLFSKALKGTRVLIPVHRDAQGRLEADVVYPV